jgi:hypothetical protein
MRPTSFQKQLRLIKATRLMLSECLSATGAALAVGYESVRQFTWDGGPATRSGQAPSRIHGGGAHRQVTKPACRHRRLSDTMVASWFSRLVRAVSGGERRSRIPSGSEAGGADNPAVAGSEIVDRGDFVLREREVEYVEVGGNP